MVWSPGSNGVQFVKKVGIVAGAFLAVITAAQVLGGCAMRAFIEPVIAQERQARIEADKIITEQLTKNARAISQVSQDRLDLLAVLEYPPGPARRREIDRVRRIWKSQNQGGNP